MLAGLTRTISCAGMHSSISAHIAQEYLLDEARDVWGPNIALFRDRLGNTGANDYPPWALLPVPDRRRPCLLRGRLAVLQCCGACCEEISGLGCLQVPE